MNDEAAKPPRKRAPRKKVSPAGASAGLATATVPVAVDATAPAPVAVRKRASRAASKAPVIEASADDAAGTPARRVPRKRAPAGKAAADTDAAGSTLVVAGADPRGTDEGGTAAPATPKPRRSRAGTRTAATTVTQGDLLAPIEVADRHGAADTAARTTTAKVGPRGDAPSSIDTAAPDPVATPKRTAPPPAASPPSPSPVTAARAQAASPWRGGGRVTVVPAPSQPDEPAIPASNGRNATHQSPASTVPSQPVTPEPSFMRAVRSPATPSASPLPHPAERRPRPPATGWRAKLDPWWRLARFDRPIGFLLLLWPTWWGLWAAAEGLPPFKLLVIFTLGVISMRAAGCVINDYADRWLDHAVKRTRGRPLAAGELGGGQALAFFLALLLVSLVLVLFTNTLTIKLAFVGAFLAATYPFLKRYTHLPQIYLGMAFGWAIPMAFAAVQGTVPALAWLLFCANILWSTAYDTFYAMVDRDDDLRVGAKSTAILLGDMDLVGIALMHGGFLLAMVFVGQQLDLGWPYWLAIAMAIALCAHQLWRARGRDRESCFRAFIDNHWVGLVLFVGLAAGLALR